MKSEKSPYLVKHVPGSKTIWILARVLDCGKCFWILARVLHSEELFLDPGTCFGF